MTTLRKNKGAPVAPKTAPKAAGVPGVAKAKKAPRAAPAAADVKAAANVESVNEAPATPAAPQVEVEAAVEAPPRERVMGLRRVFDVDSYGAEERARIEDFIGFDRGFYTSEYGDVAQAGMDVFEHYLRHGIDEGRRPADHTKPFPPGGQDIWLKEIIGFDEDYYARNYPDVVHNRAEHWASWGLREGRSAFDSYDNLQSEQILQRVLEKLDLSDQQPLEACAQLDADQWRAVVQELQAGAARMHGRPKPYRNNYWLALAMGLLARGDMGAAACCYNFFFNQYVPNTWLGNGSEWLIGTARITRLADAMAEHGEVLARPVVAPEATVNDPIFLNRPQTKPPTAEAIPLPKPVYGVLSDVEILGGTSLIFQGGHKVYYDYAETGPRAREMQCPNLMHIIDDRCSFRLPAKVRAVEEGYWMLHDHGHNYHHWLLEILPRYMVARENGLSPSVPLLVDSHLAPQMREILALLFDGPAPLIEVDRGMSLNVHRLYCMTDVCINTVHTEREPLKSDILLSPTVVEKLRALAAPYFTDLGGKMEHVHIARRNVAHRRLINRGMLDSTLKDMGLWSFDPGSTSWAQQVRVFSNARLIVSEAGASLANMIFCRPGATVIVLVQGHHCSNFYYLCELADMVGVRLFFFECLRLEGSHSIGVQEDMIVPLGQLSEWVGRFMADPDYRPDPKDFASARNLNLAAKSAAAAT